MSQEEYINKVRELEHQLSMVTSDYVNSNKIYNEGDYLRISFEVPCRDNKLIIRDCKIINIYPQNTRGESDNTSWPKGELEYFARYAYRANEDNKVCIGHVCYLGPLSHSNIICGYMNIDWNTVKIEVIKEEDVR